MAVCNVSSRLFSGSNLRSKVKFLINEIKTFGKPSDYKSSSNNSGITLSNAPLISKNNAIRFVFL